MCGGEEEGRGGEGEEERGKPDVFQPTTFPY